MKKSIITIIFCITLLAAAPYEKAGESAGQFLKIAQSARYSGMAEAAAAQAEGAQAMGFNPAGTDSAEKAQTALSFTKYLLSSFMLNVHHKQKLKPFTLGGGVRLFMHGKDEWVNNSGEVIGELVSGMNMEITINASKNIAEAVSIGGNIKFLYERQTVEYNDIGISGDVGLILHFSKFSDKLDGLNLGFSVMNMGVTGLGYLANIALPLTIRSGIGYSRDFSDAFGMSFETDIEKASDSQLKIAIGSEAVIKDMVSLQLGYKVMEGRYGMRWGLGFSIMNHSMYYNMEFREIGVVHHVDYILTFGTEEE